MLPPVADALALVMEVVGWILTYFKSIPQLICHHLSHLLNKKQIEIS